MIDVVSLNIQCNDECLWMLNADRTTLAPLTNDFKKAIIGKANAEDKKTLKTAKSKVLEQTIFAENFEWKYSIKRSIKVKSSIKWSLSTQEDICQVDISSDQNLNSILEKAKDLLKFEVICNHLLSLKWGCKLHSYWSEKTRKRF